MKIRLKEVRLSRKLSQNKLAQLVGMTLQNVQRIEYGEAKSIPLETLDKLCLALHCQPGDLLVWFPNDGGTQESSFEQQSLELKQEGEPIDNPPSSTRQRPRSILTVVPKVPESASTPFSCTALFPISF